MTLETRGFDDQFGMANFQTLSLIGTVITTASAYTHTFPAQQIAHSLSDIFLS